MEHHYAGLRRPITGEIRAGVIEDFPEIELIPNETIRALTIEAWSHALCCSDFRRINDIPPEGNPGAPVLRRGTQADHVRVVVRLTKVMAEEFERSYPQVAIDWDILMAGAVCHDV
ncbi:MAG: phosphohydrolase, partial [Tardiphaga sp.]|nr:phosphohydrolase [Tardiphaga sp.]